MLLTTTLFGFARVRILKPVFFNRYLWILVTEVVNEMNAGPSVLNFILIFGHRRARIYGTAREKRLFND
jgi:hypothetical protein